MKDKLTCSECRKKDTSECPMAKAERTVTGEFSGFKTAFENWEGCSRGEGRRMALQAIFQGKRGHRN